MAMNSGLAKMNKRKSQKPGAEQDGEEELDEIRQDLDNFFHKYHQIFYGAEKKKYEYKAHLKLAELREKMEDIACLLEAGDDT